GTEPTVEKLLENLTQYEYDVVEAYRAAKVRLSHSAETAVLNSFEQEHQQQIRNLSAISKSMGGPVPRSGDWHQILTEGKVMIAGLVGEIPILTAMTHNERNVLNAYERAVKRPDVPDNVRAVLELHHNQSLRRHTWLSERVETLTS
ncbi:MAG: DUF2383 domain-containing protein, partial [Myxococcota bacterium]